MLYPWIQVSILFMTVSVPNSPTPRLAWAQGPAPVSSDRPSLVPTIVVASQGSSPFLLYEPSGRPSVTATRSVVPAPRDSYSQFPSRVLHDSSQAPRVLTNAPRLPPLATNIPTHPSVSDVPSWGPSDVPSGRPSDVPSFIPSDFPSQTPSDAPSLYPSDAPSLTPTQVPSITPSTTPTAPPTLLPTLTPTLAWSTAPSVPPTRQKSASPSQEPTPFCHDEISYQSPINGFDCLAHNGTDCFNWRYLGLNEDQIATLITSCPVSCNVPCGALYRFHTNVSFLLAHVPTFLAPESVNILQQTALQYMTNYIQIQKFENDFDLFQVVLLSQQVTAPSTQRRRRLSTKTTSTSGYVTLLVAMAIDAFLVRLDENVFAQYLLEAIDSLGFTLSLQRSGDPALLNVIVSSVSSNVVPPSQGTATASGASAGFVVGMVFVGLVISGTVTGFVYYRHRGLVIVIPPEKEPESDGVISPSSSARSPLSTILSFESIARIVSNRLSRDSDTSEESSEDGGAKTEVMENKKIEEPPPSETAPVEEEEEEEEHPYTGLIPPMIVINRIDSHEEAPSNQSPTENNGSPRIKAVVPTKCMAATPDYIEALRSGQGTLDTTTYEGIPLVLSRESEMSAEKELMNMVEADNNDILRSLLSSHSLVEGERTMHVRSSSDGPPISVYEPVYDENGHRRTASEAEMPSPSGAARRAASFSNARAMSWIGSSDRDTASRPTSEALPVSSMESELENTSASGIVPNSNESSADLPETTSALGALRTSIWGISPARWGRKSYTAPTEDAAETGAGRSPSRWSRKSALIPSDDGSGPNNNESTAHSRKDSKSSTSSGHNLGDIDGTRLELQAPRKGKLGLLISCPSRESGPVVSLVKDYSPLLGQILPGDRIISIDGVNTTQMALSEVTALLSNQQASMWSGNTMRILFLRPREVPDELDDAADDFATFSLQGASFESHLSDSTAATKKQDNAQGTAVIQLSYAGTSEVPPPPSLPPHEEEPLDSTISP